MQCNHAIISSSPPVNIDRCQKEERERDEEEMGKRTLHKPKLKMREIKGREAREIDKKNQII